MEIRPSAHLVFAQMIEYLIKKPFSLMDYGCGDGSFLNVLDLSDITQYRGYDPNTHSITTAKTKYQKQHNFFFFSDEEKEMIFKNDFFSCAVLIGVLPYIPPLELVTTLKRIRQSLKKGGYIILSASSNYFIYTKTDIYNLLLPHRSFSKEELIYVLQQAGFKTIVVKQKGIFFAPFLSNTLLPFFDILDKVIFRTHGSLGPIGITLRNGFKPLILWEFSLPFNFGHTNFVVARK